MSIYPKSLGSLRPPPRCIPKCLTRAALANPARDTSATLPLRRVSRWMDSVIFNSATSLQTCRFWTVIEVEVTLSFSCDCFLWSPKGVLGRAAESMGFQVTPTPTPTPTLRSRLRLRLRLRNRLRPYGLRALQQTRSYNRLYLFLYYICLTMYL